LILYNKCINNIRLLRDINEIQKNIKFYNNIFVYPKKILKFNHFIIHDVIPMRILRFIYYDKYLAFASNNILCQDVIKLIGFLMIDDVIS
jgi:hypothetical protein